jgi:hypothetical protein
MSFIDYGTFYRIVSRAQKAKFWLFCFSWEFNFSSVLEIVLVTLKLKNIFIYKITKYGNFKFCDGLIDFNIF